MKRIVNGVTYNTETSSRLAESRWQADDDEERFGTLYETRGGAFFVDVEVTKPVWNQREEAIESKMTHVFEPMSPEKAHQWMLEGEVEVFHNPFDDPPEASAEAEPASTIYVRVPASLKQRVDESARIAKVSGNSWAMRCLERCANGSDIGKALGEIFYATGTCDPVKGEFSHAQLSKMIAYVGQQAVHIAKLLGFDERQIDNLNNEAVAEPRSWPWEFVK